jgi:hypothetical protein
MDRDCRWATGDVAGQQGARAAHRDVIAQPAKPLRDELREAADEGRKVMALDEQASDRPGPWVHRGGSVSAESRLLELLAWQPAAVPQALVMPARRAPLETAQQKSRA